MKTTYWPMDVSSRQNCTRNNFTLDLSNKEAQKGENRSHIGRIGDILQYSIQTVLSRIMCTTPKTLNTRKPSDQVALVQSLTILTDVIYPEACRAVTVVTRGGNEEDCYNQAPPQASSSPYHAVLELQTKVHEDFTIME